MVLFFLIKMNTNKNSIFVGPENKILLVSDAFNLVIGPTGPAGGGGDSLTMGPVSGSGTPNGATISLGVLSLAPANVINPGIVTTGDQSFVGVKNFNSSKISINEDFNLGVKTNDQYYFGNNSLGVSEGEGCIAIGTNTLSDNTGDHNIALGLNTLNNNQTGSKNIAIGTDALYVNDSGFSNIAIGRNAIKNQIQSTSNIAIGDACLQNNIVGNFNIAIGTEALSLGNSSAANIAIGCYSLLSNKGDNNVVTGVESCTYNRDGVANICMGNKSMYNDLGSYNIALGTNALYSALGSTGFYNVAVGTDSLYNNNGGTGNIAVGLNSLYSNTTGNDNIALGTNVLYNNTNGNNNIAIGYLAGSLYNSSNNIIIGNNSACMNNGNIVIGDNFTSTTAQYNIDFVTNSTSRMKFDGTNWNFGGTKYPSALGAEGTVLYSDGLGNASWGPQGSLVNYAEVIASSASVFDLGPSNIVFFENSSNDTNTLNVPDKPGKIFTVVNTNNASSNAQPVVVKINGNTVTSVEPGYTGTYLCVTGGTAKTISKVLTTP